MSNRCPQCNKFVSLEIQDADLVDADLSVFTPGESATVEATVTMQLACMDCGDVLSEADVSGSVDLDGSDLMAGVDSDDPHTHDYEVGDYEAVIEDRFETKTGDGRRITHSRYMKHLYWATVTVTLRCAACDHEITVEVVTDEAQGADFMEV